MATGLVPRRASRERRLVTLATMVVLVAGVVGAAAGHPVQTDVLDLAATSYDPSRDPDRHVADAVASAMGDDTATDRILAALAPEAAAAIDPRSFDDVQSAIAGARLEVAGILLRDDEQISVLVDGPGGPFTATVTHPAGRPEQIDGMLLSAAPVADDGTVSDVEVVLLAAAMLALVAAGLSGRPARWCWVAGLVCGMGMLERTGWEPLQDLAVIAVPASLTIAVVGAAGRRRPQWLGVLVATAALLSLLPLLSVDPGAARPFGHLITVQSLVGRGRALQQVSAVAALVAASTGGAWFVRAVLRADRRSDRWQLAGGAAAGACIAGLAVVGLVDPAPIDVTTTGWATAALVVIAAGRAAGLAHRHADLSAIAAAAVDLSAGRAADLTTVLARALDDPTVAVLHARGAGYVDRDGHPTALPDDPLRSTRLAIDGETVGAIVHQPVVADDPERLRAACDAVALSLANERLTAQIRWQLEEVRASRQRLVHAEERARQRIERDLHDGAQQRLTAATLALRMLQGTVASSAPDVAVRLAPIADELQLATDEIRELARGVRPATLDGGLVAAAEDLAERAAIPVTIDSTLTARLPAEVETAAYFVISEALTNATRHADARHVTVSLHAADGWLVVAVSDDGVGISTVVLPGERPSTAIGSGTGLVGLFDRVDAHGGSLTVAPVGEGRSGTLLEARLPCGS